MEPVEYLTMKYGKDNLLETEDVLKYLEIEFKAILEENIKLKKFKFFSDCFKALDSIQKRFEDFQEEKKDEQAAQIEELSEQLKKLHEDKNKLLEQGLSLKEENEKLKKEVIQLDPYKNGWYSTEGKEAFDKS